MKYVKYGILGGVSAVLVASAVIAEEGNSNPPFCTKENDFCQGFEMSIQPQATISHTIEMQGEGKPVEAKFFSFELTAGANAMLHDYVPHINDTVEWYVRRVDCTEPDKSCKFELAIRKHKTFWPFW